MSDKDTLKRILFGSNHENILEAVAADITDVIPVVGDISNIIRVKNTKVDDNRARRQVLDAAIGIIPFIGEVFDVITPTNIVNFIEKDMKDKKPQPLIMLDKIIADIDSIVKV